MITAERQKEIEAATPENPVHLTRDEMLGMNQNQLKVGVGAGRFTVEPDEGGKKNIARVLEMKASGKTHAEIAEEMGIRELTVRRLEASAQ